VAVEEALGEALAVPNERELFGDAEVLGLPELLLVGAGEREVATEREGEDKALKEPGRGAVAAGDTEAVGEKDCVAVTGSVGLALTEALLAVGVGVAVAPPPVKDCVGLAKPDGGADALAPDAVGGAVL
jgi:hypothetical protein